MEFEKNIVVNDVCQATVSVKIQKEEIQKEYEALVVRYSKELALPGFRRGKVPVSVLNAKYSKAILDDLRANVIKDVSDRVFEDIEASQIPMFPEDVEFHKENEFELGSDWLFTIRYEVRPNVKIEKDEGFVLNIPAIYVSEEDIQKELVVIQERNALIKDRGDDEGVSAGDLVTVDYQVFDGEKEERAVQDHTFTQSTPSTQYCFENDVLGMKKGEQKEIVKSYGDDCEAEHLRGKERRILITIKAIKERILPPLDDELAQDVSAEYKTLEDLKQDIKNKLQKQAGILEADAWKEDLIKNIAKENNVYIPESLIARAFGNEYGQMLRNYKMSKEDLEKVSYSLYKASEPRLRLQLQGQFIIEALIKKYEITADDESVQAYLQEVSQEEGVPMETLQSFISEPEKKEVFVMRTKQKKLFDTLRAKSVVNEGEKISLNAYIAKTEALDE